MTEETKELVPIVPIREVVTGYSVKVQVQLDEDASDQQVLSSLDDACRQWSNVQKIDLGLRLVVGRLLMAVRERGIHRQEEWGTFELFLKDIERRYGIKRSSAWNALMIVEADPELSVERAKEIGSSNLLEVARASKLAVERGVPPAKVRRMTEKLLREAEKRPPVEEFRQRLANANLIRVKSQAGHRGVKIVLDNVSPRVAAQWRELTQGKNSVRVFSDLVRIAHSAEQRHGSHQARA